MAENIQNIELDELYEAAKEREIYARSDPKKFSPGKSLFDFIKSHGSFVRDHEDGERECFACGGHDSLVKSHDNKAYYCHSCCDEKDVPVNKTFPSIHAFNFNRFMTSKFFVPINPAIASVEDGKCYITEKNGFKHSIFNFPSTRPEHSLDNCDIQYICDLNTCDSRIVQENKWFEKSNYALQSLKRDKDLYDRLDRYVGELSSKLDQKADDSSTTSKIENTLKNYGFESLVDYKHNSQFFKNTYSENLNKTMDDISNCRNNLKLLHYQKAIIEKRIVEVVDSLYKDYYPLIKQVDKESKISIYNVNIQSGRTHTMSFLYELSPNTKDREISKDVATHMLNGTLPGKPPIHKLSIER